MFVGCDENATNGTFVLHSLCLALPTTSKNVRKGCYLTLWHDIVLGNTVLRAKYYLLVANLLNVQESKFETIWLQRGQFWPTLRCPSIAFLYDGMETKCCSPFVFVSNMLVLAKCQSQSWCFVEAKSAGMHDVKFTCL